jgi:hypothetical protein
VLQQAVGGDRLRGRVEDVLEQAVASEAAPTTTIS